jgi:hypothetical protein
MTGKGYRCKLKRDFCEALMQMIDKLLMLKLVDKFHRLLLCVLAEIRGKLYKAMCDYRREYTMTFTPAQAMGLRMLYVEFFKNHTSYEGNILHKIANEVHKQYQ